MKIFANLISMTLTNLIRGSQINYYFICKTKLWLFSHNIQMEQESDAVSLGKQLHNNTYKREKDYLIDNLINIDFIKKTKDIEIHEIKKTPKMKKSHEYQLLYYMYYLKNEKNIEDIVGYIDYPKIKKRNKLFLTSEKEEEIKKIIKEIAIIVDSEIPSPEKLKICKKCAYYELCWV